MIPRSFRLRGYLLLVAVLLVALVPTLVRAASTPANADMRVGGVALPTHMTLSHGRLQARAHSSAVRVLSSRVRDSLRGLTVSDPNALRVTWPQSIQVQTTTQSNYKWAIQLFSSNPGTVVGDLGALDQYSDASPFVRFHDVGYVQSHPQNVFAQNAVFTLGTVGNGNGQNPYYFRVAWLGSIYSSPSEALARVADARNHLQNTYGAAPSDCSANNDGSCELIGFEGGGDIGAADNYYVYVIFSIDNVVGELVFSASDSDIASDGGDQLFLDATFSIFIDAHNQVVAADTGSAAPTPTATSPGNNVPPPPATATLTAQPTATPRPTNTSVPQPQVKLDGIGIATLGKDKKLHTAKKLKSAQAGYFLAQIKVANSGFNSPSAQITYAYKGKAIATDQMKQVPTGLDLRSLAGLHPNQAAQTLSYYDIFGLKKLKKALKLKATVDVSVGSAHDSGSITFSVKTNCKTTHGKKTCK